MGSGEINATGGNCKWHPYWICGPVNLPSATPARASRECCFHERKRVSARYEVQQTTPGCKKKPLAQLNLIFSKVAILLRWPPMPWDLFLELSFMTTGTALTSQCSEDTSVFVSCITDQRILVNELDIIMAPYFPGKHNVHRLDYEY
jgi:hypothetical protein